MESSFREFDSSTLDAVAGVDADLPSLANNLSFTLTFAVQLSSTESDRWFEMGFRARGAGVASIVPTFSLTLLFSA